MSTAGPPPTHLALLADLHRFRPGQKVRFLGCIETYNPRLGIATLQHDFPRGNGRCARVDVRLLLETLGTAETRGGEWVNVMGYVTAKSGKAVDVQAIVYWSAGAVQIERYESALVGVKAEMKEMKAK